MSVLEDSDRHRPPPSVTAKTMSDPDLEGIAVVAGEPTHKPPRDLGRYRVLRELGRGGMGVVVEAYDPSLDRKVALKLLGSPGRERPARRQLREAQALARLSHPNVVSVYEIDTVDGQDFIAMELVEGQALSLWHKTPRPWPEIVDAYVQAGRGLAAAHAQGLVHRDFKPSNCLIDATGRVRVADFGLAGDQDELRSRGDDSAERTPSSGASALPRRRSGPLPSVSGSSAFSERLTRPGARLGTPAYMSPEQRWGGPLDARSDQFSFCASLCEALFGQPCLPVDRPIAPPRTGPRVPRAIRRVLERGMEPEPAHRWASMDELLHALERRRRRDGRWRWAVGVLTANLVVAALVWGPGDAPERCDHARERLRGVWDDQSEAAVQAAIVGTALPYAEDAWAVVDERLSGYAERWVATHTETCRAAHVRGELSLAGLDRRMDCLERRRLALLHAVELLREADAEVVEQAVPLVTGLPSVERCTDLRALQATPRPPEARAESVASLRAQLDRARTRLQAGKYEAGLRLAQTAIPLADSVGYEPLQAEARLIRGNLYLALGRHREAHDDLRVARSTALRLDHADVAAEASAALTFVVGVPLSQRESALLVGDSALALAQRVDAGGLREAEALLGLGQVLAQHGDDSGAQEHFTRALAILEGRPDADPLDLVGALDGLRGALRRQGRLVEAEDLARRAIARVERDLGKEHPAMVHRLANLATVLVDRDRHADAEQVLRRALELGARTLPAEHPALAHAHGNLGAVLLYQRRYDEATAELERALGLWRHLHSEGHDRVADVLVNLGVAARARGQTAVAEHHYRQALEQYAAAYGADHPKIAQAELNRGRLLEQLGRDAEAAECFERARAAAERYGGPEHIDVAKALQALGLHEHRAGRPAEARARLRRALELFERALPPDRPSARVARALWALGRTELALGDLESARAHLERARRMQTDAETSALDRARTELVLAQLAWTRTGTRHEARALARQALDRLTDESDPAVRRLRDEVSAWLDEPR